MRRIGKTEQLQALRDVFGLQGFRPGQKEAVEALIAGRDTLCILPTGAGKSLCWQLPAVLRPGLTVVVSPLIALMRDQLRSLREKGVDALCLDSLQEPSERETVWARLEQGSARIVLVSPERLETRRFVRALRAHPPWLVVVDEAHCIVRWGESFRPAYRHIADFLAQLPSRPVICAMTATADDAARAAIVENLGMRRVKACVLPVLRENLHYAVRSTTRKDAVILSELRARQGGKCVIFCRTRERTERLAQTLCRAGFRAGCYHAGMEREARMDAQRRFMSGETRVMTATSAFGMGVDVPDIRLVIHDCMPSSIMDFAQQSGRAGRDGQAADCILLMDPGDLEFHRRTMMAAAYAMHLPWLERRRKFASARRDMRRMLTWCLNGSCLTAGLSRAFGQREKPCGTCSVCLARKAGQPLRRVKVPQLWAMQAGDLAAWAIDQAQRDYFLARKLSPRGLLGERTLEKFARSGGVPEDCGLPAELVGQMRAVFERTYDHRV